MTSPLRLSLVFAAGLIAIAALRWLTVHAHAFADASSAPTLLFVAWVVVFAIALGRAGIGLTHIGLRRWPSLHDLFLGLAGAAALRGVHALLDPLWLALFGAGRDLSRFDAAGADISALMALIAFSWTFAALGEELAFRGLLMRGLKAGLGDGRGAAAIALIVQAAVFAAVHLYQGPAGVTGAFISGLIYGALVLMARGSLWPAVIAHGASNTVGLALLYLQANA